LLKELQYNQHIFQRFVNFISIPASSNYVILRHDVDLKPENSLATAKLVHSLGIQGTYYFRIISETFKPDIIKQIEELGHEIGYHYEDMDLVQADNLDKHINLAYESFCRNLERLRKVAPVNTACMHGSPRAKYDNKMIWSKYNYRDLGIIGEPYFDIDFNEFLYLTDTGRRWNGDKVSVRDRVNTKYDFNFKTTQDIIDAIPQLPDKIMINIHPQRWNDKLIPWTTELVSQNLKNIVKYFLIRSRNSRF